MSPIGIVMRSKYGAPTVIWRSCSASTSSGNSVPSSTTNANTANSTLLARNAASRDSGESIVPGERSRSPRQAISPSDTATTTPKNPSRYGADRAVAERVHAAQHARPGEERAQDRERERGHEQRQVPHPQHPPAFLHEHRVDVRGGGQPRQQAGVLDRVPRPHAAPAEHLVAPPAAEQDADREERPREQRPAPRLHQPALADPPGDQRGDGERERHRHADVAEVEDRRVEQHEHVVLQQRVRALGRTRDAGRPVGERVGRVRSSAARRTPMMTNITTSAQPTSGSPVRFRKRHPTAAVKAARITIHSRIEPSSADHIAATL